MARPDRTGNRTPAQRRPARLLAAGIVIGIGIGGLVDGVVLHQVLQWHHLTSGVDPPAGIEALRRNVFWDGVFHAATTALLLAGLVVLWGVRGRTVPPGASRGVLGLVLAGWGAFHVFDQLVFHELLGLHDIREGVADPAVYNWGFFAIGLVLIAAGWWLRRRTAAPAGRAQRGGTSAGSGRDTES